MKKWLSMMLIGVLLLGIGSGVAIVEMSHYTFGDYTSKETFTAVTVVDLSAGYPVVFENNGYAYEVVIDSTLGDQARIEYPTYNFLTINLYNSGENHLYLSTNSNSFGIFGIILDELKEGRVFSFSSTDVKVKLYLNETYAKSLSRYSDRDHQEQSEEYQQQMDQQSEEYQQQINQQAEEYQQQIDEQAEQYQQQIDALQQELEQLQQKLDELNN